MYTCRIEKRVWREPDHSSDCTVLFYELENETPPKVGMEVNEGRWYSGPLTFVIWNVDDERFLCRAEDEYPVSDRDYDYSYEWIVENFLLQGWHAAEV